MLIGQFNDSFPPITDGVASVVRNYAHWITREPRGDSRCVVVTPDVPRHQDASEIFEVVRYASVPFPFRKPYRFGMPHIDPQLMIRLQGIPFDLIHAHCPFSAGQLALGIAKRRKVPFVATFHTKYREEFLPIVRSPVIADALTREVVRFFERADSVWTVNDASVETLREYGYKGPVVVLKNGSDLLPSDPSRRRSPACASVCHSLGVREDETVFLYVGQHIWQKNLRLLIESLALVKRGLMDSLDPPPKDGRPTFRMFFVGGGEAEKEMKERLEELGLSSEARFLGVVRDRDILRGLFERADLQLFPSTYDTAGLVVMEAATALCPTLVIEGSSISEGIVEGVNGYLSKESVEDYAAAVLRALSDREGLRRAGLNAQRDMHRHWSLVAEEVLVLYRDIIERFQDRLERES
jgi:glycosyltransferase involved in cell wall biosynthesis